MTLIGLYVLADALTAIPRHIHATLELPQIIGLASKLGDSTAATSAQVPFNMTKAVAASFLSLVPGAILLFLRRPIASWLLPARGAIESSVTTEELVRVGTMLMGLYFILTAIVGMASAAAADRLVGGTAPTGVGRSLLAPTVRAIEGVLLCAYSRRFARWLVTPRPL